MKAKKSSVARIYINRAVISSYDQGHVTLVSWLVEELLNVWEKKSKPC